MKESASGSEKTRVRVLLVDDERMIRDAIALLLESAFGLDVRPAASARDAFSELAAATFDVVLLDVRMPDIDGIEALASIKRVKPSLPIVMLSSHDDVEDVRASMDAGANGYVLKGAAAQQLKDAIDVAIAGEGVYLHPLVAGRMLGRPGPPELLKEPLTDRELEVLRVLVDGATNEQIAQRLAVSQKTVKSHLSTLFRKLGASNRTEAVSKAIRGAMLAAEADDPTEPGSLAGRTS